MDQNCRIYSAGHPESVEREKKCMSTVPLSNQFNLDPIYLNEEFLPTHIPNLVIQFPSSNSEMSLCWRILSQEVSNHWHPSPKPKSFLMGLFLWLYSHLGPSLLEPSYLLTTQIYTFHISYKHSPIHKERGMDNKICFWVLKNESRRVVSYITNIVISITGQTKRKRHSTA